MRIIITILLLVGSLEPYAQDTSKIKQINSLVSTINTSLSTPRRDTLVQDRPEMGLKMTTYLTMIVNDSELLKYVNLVRATMVENGVAKQMEASNTFYYSHNKLIKVEEYDTESGVTTKADWYYSNGKSLFYTVNSDKSEERASLLLTMSEMLLKKVIK